MSQLVDLDVTLEHATEKAFKVSTLSAEHVWVPRSLSEFDASGKPEHRWMFPMEGVLTLKKTLAEEKGLV